MRTILEPDPSNEYVIVANRLPVNRVTTGRRTGWEMSPGGLVSALRPILRNSSSTWVGWTGIGNDHLEPFVHDGITQQPVQLSAGDIRSYYEGFSNRTIWPLYHDAIREPEYRQTWWETYHSVNQRFAETVAGVSSPSSVVWVHDYHLQLVPGMLRELRPDLRVGFFLHIPFPPQELFARLP